MTYLPLAYMTIAVVGGFMALANIDPVAPAPRYVTIGRASGRDGLAFGIYTPAVTPPGDPAVFWDTPKDGRPFTGPISTGTPRLGDRLFVKNRWTSPPPPEFAPQAPTPDTGEQEALCG
jgi:hypothetical protein